MLVAHERHPAASSARRSGEGTASPAAASARVAGPSATGHTARAGPPSGSPPAARTPSASSAPGRVRTSTRLRLREQRVERGRAGAADHEHDRRIAGRRARAARARERRGGIGVERDDGRPPARLGRQPAGGERRREAARGPGRRAAYVTDSRRLGRRPHACQTARRPRPPREQRRERHARRPRVLGRAEHRDGARHHRLGACRRANARRLERRGARRSQQEVAHRLHPAGPASATTVAASRSPTPGTTATGRSRTARRAPPRAPRHGRPTTRAARRARPPSGRRPGGSPPRPPPPHCPRAHALRPPPAADRPPARRGPPAAGCRRAQPTPDPRSGSRPLGDEARPRRRVAHRATADDSRDAHRHPHPAVLAARTRSPSSRRGGSTARAAVAGSVPERCRARGGTRGRARHPQRLTRHCRLPDREADHAHERQHADQLDRRLPAFAVLPRMAATMPRGHVTALPPVSAESARKCDGTTRTRGSTGTPDTARTPRRPRRRATGSSRRRLDEPWPRRHRHHDHAERAVQRRAPLVRQPRMSMRRSR